MIRRKELVVGMMQDCHYFIRIFVKSLVEWSSNESMLGPIVDDDGAERVMVVLDRLFVYHCGFMSVVFQRK